MVWKREDPQGNEAGKIRWELPKYTRGQVLDIGCGGTKAFPHFIGLDSGKDIQLFGHQFRPDVWITDAQDLSIFATESCDAVFSSHLLEHIEPKDVVKTLREWFRVVKVGGHVLLYLPDETLYPKVGEEGANPDHRWNVSYLKLMEMMQATGCHWDLIDWQRRDEGQEYSLFTVFKKTHKGQAFSCSTRQKPQKTAAVVRYGAYGDLLQCSSVVAGLKKQGFHVTLYTAAPGHSVIENDPNIDEFYIQDKDQVPNHLLGEFWAYESRKYDRWVNLSESVERTFLCLPHTTMALASPVARHMALDVNYMEYQHALAGVPHEPQMRFFSTPDEKKWAKAERKRFGELCLVYALNGSSVHKRWPWMDQLIAALLVDFPALHIVLVGGEDGQILEQGWFEWDRDPKDPEAKKVQTEPRVHCRSGKWSIRQSLAFLEEADMVFGPETGVLNAAAMLPIPKVLLLSHSTVQNLSRDWVNTHSLYSKGTTCPGRGQDEAPACHQMHYGWDGCRQAHWPEGGPLEGPVGVSQCQFDLSFDQVYRVVWHVVTDLAKSEAA